MTREEFAAQCNVDLKKAMQVQLDALLMTYDELSKVDKLDLLPQYCNAIMANTIKVMETYKEETIKYLKEYLHG